MEEDGKGGRWEEGYFHVKCYLPLLHLGVLAACILSNDMSFTGQDALLDI